MRERMDYDKPDYVTHEEESEEYLNELRLTPEAMSRYLSMMELIPTLEMPLDVIPDPEVLLEQSDNDRQGNYDTEYRVSESERYEEQGGVPTKSSLRQTTVAKRSTVTDTKNIGDVHAAGSTGATGLHRMSGTPLQSLSQ